MRPYTNRRSDPADQPNIPKKGNRLLQQKQQAASQQPASHIQLQAKQQATGLTSKAERSKQQPATSKLHPATSQTASKIGNTMYLPGEQGKKLQPTVGQPPNKTERIRLPQSQCKTNVASKTKDNKPAIKSRHAGSANEN
jgi:hypothetical protein